jgi:hypothetical protein
MSSEQMIDSEEVLTRRESNDHALIEFIVHGVLLSFVAIAGLKRQKYFIAECA